MCAVDHRQAMPADHDEHLLMSVFRFITAAYETGDADCWEAAHAHAEDARGIFDGPLLVAQAAAVIRLVRTEQTPFSLLPPSSRWLSADEVLLMRLIRNDCWTDRGSARAILDSGAASVRLVDAVRALLDHRPDAPQRIGRAPTHAVCEERTL